MKAKGKWPKTTDVILNNLSLDPLKIKFQRACKNEANKTAAMIKGSIINLPQI